MWHHNDLDRQGAPRTRNIERQQRHQLRYRLPCFLAFRASDFRREFSLRFVESFPITTPPPSRLSCTAPAPVSTATSFKTSFKVSPRLWKEKLFLTKRTILVGETTCSEEQRRTTPATMPPNLNIDKRAPYSGTTRHRSEQSAGTNGAPDGMCMQGVAGSYATQFSPPPPRKKANVGEHPALISRSQQYSRHHNTRL